jgi:hypothetical protein
VLLAEKFATATPRIIPCKNLPYPSLSKTGISDRTGEVEELRVIACESVSLLSKEGGEKFIVGWVEALCADTHHGA